MKEVELSKIFPYHKNENNYIITGYGYITAGFDVLLPEIFTVNKKYYNDFVNSVSNQVKGLPEGSILHFQGFYFTDEYVGEVDEAFNITKLKNTQHYAFKHLLKNYCRVYLSFRIGKYVSKKANTVFTLKQYLFEEPSKELRENINRYEQIVEGFGGALQSLGLSPTRLDNKGLACALYDYWSLKFDKPSGTYEDKLLGVNEPYAVDDDGIMVGNNHVAVLTLSRQSQKIYTSVLPKTESADTYENNTEYINDIMLDTSFTFPIGVGLPINHITNVVIEVESNDKYLAELDNESWALNFGAGVGKFGGDRAQAKKDRIALFKDSVQNGGYQICKCSVNVILLDKSRKQLNKYIELTKTAFGNMNDSKCFVENKKTLMEFTASAPGNTKVGERKFFAIVETGISYWPKESNYYSSADGVMFLDRYGNPIVVNMWDNKYIVARNKVIFGPTGTGKSFLINHLISESLGLGHHVVGIDVGGSYIRSVELNNGRYFDAEDKDKLVFNPFLTAKGASGEYYLGMEDVPDPDYDKTYDISFLYTVISTAWKKEKSAELKEETVQILKNQIQAFYKHINSTRGVPSFDSFYRFVLDVYKEGQGKVYDRAFFDYGSFELILKNFCHGGTYGQLLNADVNIDFKNDRYIIFDLEAIERDNDIKGLVAVMIINLVTKKVEQVKGERVTFLIDEAIDFLQGDMGDFIGGMYRKIRKKNGEVYIATQSVGFLESAHPLVRKSITSNSQTVMLLNHKSVRGESYPLLQQYFSLTDADLQLLDSIQVHHEKGYGEVFLKMGDLSRVFRLQLSDFSMGVYTTRKDEINQINKINEKVNNLALAIQTFIDNKKKKVWDGKS